jgi:hypothetical protein
MSFEPLFKLFRDHHPDELPQMPRYGLVPAIWDSYCQSRQWPESHQFFTSMAGADAYYPASRHPSRESHSHRRSGSRLRRMPASHVGLNFTPPRRVLRPCLSAGQRQQSTAVF